MENQKRKIPLTKLDDLFTTQKERDEANLEKIYNISLSNIDDFPNHPFKVLDNEDMDKIVDSVKEKGVLNPIIVRKKEDGRYEIISGHRRKRASQLVGLETIPCIVRELSNDEATIEMVDSNLQREQILPSEKAFAYKMKLDAMNHQGKETSRQIVDKLKSADVIGKERGESGRTVQRFIRLTYLIPELLQLVDNDVLKLSPSIALSPAVSISFLTKEEQLQLLDIIECNFCTPSHSQAIRLKDLSEHHELTIETMEKIMSEEKPNQVPTLKVSMNKLKTILPRSLRNDKEREEYVIKAVEWYDKYLKKIQERKQQER